MIIGFAHSAAIHPLGGFRLGINFPFCLQTVEKSFPWSYIASKRRYVSRKCVMKLLKEPLTSKGILQMHERLQLESEPSSRHPLVVLQWKLALLKLCNRKEIFIDSSDYGLNRSLLLEFKKNCGNTIKFAVKNVPFAMIQVSIWKFLMCTVYQGLQNIR